MEGVANHTDPKSCACSREDVAIVESVHRGMSSLGYDQSRYVVDRNDDWYSESGLHRFHRQILKALEGDDE